MERFIEANKLPFQMMFEVINSKDTHSIFRIFFEERPSKLYLFPTGPSKGTQILNFFHFIVKFSSCWVHIEFHCVFLQHV